MTTYLIRKIYKASEKNFEINFHIKACLRRFIDFFEYKVRNLEIMYYFVK